MYRYIFIPLMLLSFSVTGGIYKWVDDEGKIHYSDKEVKGAEQVELPKAVTYTPTTPNIATESEEESQKAFAYTEITIVKPEMNETIRNNNGDVVVTMDLKPALRAGDSITLFLDGDEKVKGLTQTSVTLSKLDRGSHTLRASVFNKDGVALISSGSVIFHLKIEAGESEDHTPTDNSEAYTPDFKQDESIKADYSKDYSKDYSDDYSKDFGSSNSYKDNAEKYKTGIPSDSGNFKAGTSTYSPNYQQKK